MSAQPSKLAEFAAPTRGRVKYASLTAGLLARKGEAVPATPYFAVDALDHHAGVQAPTPLHPEPADTEPLRTGGEAVDKSEAGVEDEQRRTTAAYRAASRFWRPRFNKGRAAPNAEPKPAAEPTVELFDLPPRDEPAPEAVAPLATSAMAPSVKDGTRAVLSVELDLQCLARLAGHAHQKGKTAAEVIEAALNDHLRANDDMWTI
jgi:hypothetical protein